MPEELLDADFFSAAAAAASLSASSFIYDGAEKKPAITIKAGKKQLTLNKDYTISYKNNTNVGTASVTVTGKGNYTGTISKSFTIAATNLSTADVKLSAASFTYNGKAFTPSVTVTCNGKVLTNGTDYSVAYTNNINAGTSRVTITGIGAYSGVKTVTFRIKRAKATLTPTAAALTLTQSSRKTAVIKRKKTDGKISLKSSNSKIVKISGTSIIPLSPGKATVTITAAQGRNYNAVSAKISISVRPLPVSSLSLKSSAKGQATASWNQVKSITSYQIQYSTASSMKSAKTITVKGTSKSAVLKKLKAVVREIMEELDTEVEVKELFDTVEYDYPKFHLSMDCFICKIKKGDLVLKEHEAAKWLAKETLHTVDWLPADYGLVEKLREMLSLQ